MTANELLSKLMDRGIALRVVENRIQAKPMSELRSDEREQLKVHKVELLRLLSDVEPHDGILDSDERHRLMTETLERLNCKYKGHTINWFVLDRINEKIALTSGRRELMKLLQRYESEFLREPPS